MGNTKKMDSRGRLRRYLITSSISRSHRNPPYENFHSHDFVVRLHLTAYQKNGEIYGVDMCIVEDMLNHFLAGFPDNINDLPGVENGTTEELSDYVYNEMKKLLADFCVLTNVEVGETINRITINI